MTEIQGNMTPIDVIMSEIQENMTEIQVVVPPDIKVMDIYDVKEEIKYYSVYHYACNKYEHPHIKNSVTLFTSVGSAYNYAVQNSYMGFDTSYYIIYRMYVDKPGTNNDGLQEEHDFGIYNNYYYNYV